METFWQMEYFCMVGTIALPSLSQMSIQLAALGSISFFFFVSLRFHCKFRLLIWSWEDIEPSNHFLDAVSSCIETEFGPKKKKKYVLSFLIPYLHCIIYSFNFFFFFLVILALSLSWTVRQLVINFLLARGESGQWSFQLQSDNDFWRVVSLVRNEGARKDPCALFFCSSCCCFFTTKGPMLIFIAIGYARFFISSMGY